MCRRGDFQADKSGEQSRAEHLFIVSCFTSQHESTVLSEEAFHHELFRMEGRMEGRMR